MAEIERFRLIGNHPKGAGLYREGDGPWVRWSDHRTALATELERLAEEFEGFAGKRKEKLGVEAGAHCLNAATLRLRERAAEYRQGASETDAPSQPDASSVGDQLGRQEAAKGEGQMTNRKLPQGGGLGFTEVPIADELLAVLSADWSSPIELKVEGGELILRDPAPPRYTLVEIRQKLQSHSAIEALDTALDPFGGERSMAGLEDALNAVVDALEREEEEQ